MDSILLKALLGAIVFLTGAFSAVWTQTVQDSSIVNQILGPLGALAFAIVAIGFLVRYLMKQQKRLEDIQDARVEDLKNTIKELREDDKAS